MVIGDLTVNLLFFVVAAGDAVPFCGGGVWGWRSRGKL
jgi:hypothetical protein